MATRVYGPDLTPHLLNAAEEEGIPVGFYGGSPQVLKRLIEVVLERYSRLRVAYAWSPPFRPLGPEEDQRVTDEINGSGARILFVGLNTPKQDLWMAHHRGRIPAVMLGVGAAFDFLAGSKPQAPRWMMRAGLEWLFRLATEPRRLWRRYLYQNPRFVLLFLMQLLGLKRFPSVP
jgi:N-acetylglucosaminyldiphosphoundecaprenol N-acetyl-beta-D-mannosaminyltransferase